VGVFFAAALISTDFGPRKAAFGLRLMLRRFPVLIGPGINLFWHIGPEISYPANCLDSF